MEVTNFKQYIVRHTVKNVTSSVMSLAIGQNNGFTLLMKTNFVKNTFLDIEMLKSTLKWGIHIQCFYL